MYAALMIWIMSAQGYPFHLRWRGWTPALREVAGQYGLVLLSGLVASGGLLVDQAMAATMPSGSVATLAYANRVVIVPAGIGTRPPRTLSAGRISQARCYGDLVTLEPTGIVLIRAGQHLTLSDLFRSSGQPLSSSRLGPFPAPHHTRVTVYVGGQHWNDQPGDVPLEPHAEIVLEVGPHVPPHTTFTFPPGT